jgi:hypothetical protein
VKLAALVLIALLTGCASASKTYGPDGREAYTLTCSGAARSWSNCYAKAGKICGTKGYDVLSQNGDQNAIITGSNGNFAGASGNSRSLLISCKS